MGIAGGTAKCDYVVQELGFDACVDYKAGRLYDDLKDAVPKGINVLFENVGGKVFDTVLRLMNPFSRVSLCGLISQYNATDADELYGMKNIRSVLVNRIRMQGFIVSDRLALWPRAMAELGDLYARGALKYRESIVQGIDQAPGAFLALLQGGNFGKQLVKLI